MYERLAGIEPAHPVWKPGTPPLCYSRVTGLAFGACLCHLPEYPVADLGVAGGHTAYIPLETSTTLP